MAQSRRRQNPAASDDPHSPHRSILALDWSPDEPTLNDGERRWRREARSAWLRLAVLFILGINLLAGEHGRGMAVHGDVLIGYALATCIALALVVARRAPTWAPVAFVVADATVAVALFHEHLLGSAGTLDHTLTAPALAIAFLLLNHVALRLEPVFVLLFAGLVILGWLSLIAFTAVHHNGGVAAADFSAFGAEAALAASFAFAAFVGILLTRDHNVILRNAVRSEQRRRNLSRFFSPSVVSELQSKPTSLKLARREVAIMFVDLRAFTGLSELLEPESLAELLSEYRALVIQAVFAEGGSIDKFIGDGVMAVFGQPHQSPDDASRALQCALRLRESLAGWRGERKQGNKACPDAGIGLHFGMVIGGILESGGYDEFTIFGDAVNVAERLERLSKMLDATLVVSAELLERAAPSVANQPWTWKDAAALDGRSGRMRVAYLGRSNEHG